MQKKRFDLQEWVYAVLDNVNQKKEEHDKVVVFVSGASASGKTYASEKLKEKLEEKGNKCLVFSTDNFYKGMAKMISEKASKNFYNNKLDVENVANITRKIIENSNFENKFSPKNKEKLLKEFMAFKKLDKNKSRQLVNNLETEYKRINFDEPEAVDLKKTAQTINMLLKKDKKVEIPNYSMITSESRVKKEDIKFSNDYDVLIVEGIYSMNKIIIKNVSSSIQIRNFIESDIKTILVRRLKRDIIDKRSSMEPEVDLFITLNMVIPSYKKYIAKDKKNANFILLSPYSMIEAKAPQNIDAQEKIKLKDYQSVQRLEEKLSEFEKLGNLNEKDYYFTNGFEYELEKQHLLRLRLVDGKMDSLVHKSVCEYRLDEKIVRPTQTFLTKEDFKGVFTSFDDLKKAFLKSDFQILSIVNKKRKVYKYKDCQICLDKVDGLGYFVEISAIKRKSIPQMDKIKEKLELRNSEKVDAYFVEKINSYKNENEMKFLLAAIPDGVETYHNIEQKYLEEDLKLKKEIEKIFSKTTIDWNKVNQIRIRKWDNYYYVTMKESGDVSRLELEEQIDEEQYKSLSNYKVLGEIKKKRAYISLKQGLTIALDVFKKGLVIAEIEFDSLKFSEEDVEKIVKEAFRDAKNISYEYKFKNINMAKDEF